MFSRYQVTGLLVSLTLALGLLGLCGPRPEPPVVSEISVDPGTTIQVGESASLTVRAAGTDLQFEWTVSRGRLSSPTAPSVIYEAPNSPGPDTVTVIVTGKGGSTIESITFQVIEPTAILAATPIQTVTPTPTEPPSPTPTLALTPISGAIVDSGVYCTDKGGGGTETIQVEPPRTVARIRIDMAQRATEHGDSLWEVEAYGPDTGDTNLVIGGQAYASSAQDSFGCEGCLAERAIDGDMNTRWSSVWSDPQWLEITLPALQVVNRIELEWEAAYARKYCVTVAEQVTPTPTDTPMPTFTPSPAPAACPPADAEGTVPPTIAISSITFVVNGVEQVVRDVDALRASSGDQVQVREVTICPVEPFGGGGGSVYVEFDPVDQNGQVMASEVKGTQAVGVTPGSTSVSGPGYIWTIGDNWRHLSVVTVHYPPGGGTQNPNCEGGACEVDDRVIVPIQ